MPSKTRSYRDWLGAKLADPGRASRYLNKASEDSEAMFLKALRKVAMSQSRSMTELAESCGISRESLYRMLSETGNPTSENRRAILAAIGLKSIVVPLEPKGPSRRQLSDNQSLLDGSQLGEATSGQKKHLAGYEFFPPRSSTVFYGVAGVGQQPGNSNATPFNLATAGRIAQSLVAASWQWAVDTNSAVDTVSIYRNH